MVRFSLVAMVLCLGFTMEAQQEYVLKWEVQHPITQEWIALGERGSVQEALYAHGLLPDPFYGTNEDQYAWIEDHSWKFKSRFFLSEEMFNAPQVALNFPCIDTYASIFLNGKLILTAENYFRPYQVQVRSLLQLGYNEVEALFTPPVLFHKTAYENADFHYPAPNDNAKIKAAPLTRKPQYQFGWDWAPRINTLGFPFPVTVSVVRPRMIEQCVVNTLEIGTVAKLEGIFKKDLSVKAKSFRSVAFGWEVPCDSSELQRVDFEIEQPELWWPHDQGRPYIYEDTLLVMNALGEVIEIFPYRFGIRTVKLLQEKDAWGTSFAFEINGKPMFIKGGDMIPPSMFGGATSKKEWESWVDLMVESHFNMVRIWGGGDYATEDFLDACDKAGLMVWHDAMFACAMYPGDSAFLNNVQQELEYQFPRITKHPSVVYVNGNNEVEVAWKNWGFQTQYSLGKSEQNSIEKAYDALFKDLMPSVLVTFSNLPYVHTSPLSNWGKPEYYNHGTQHYWGVWHGSDPMKAFEQHIGRFNAEFGFQSFPEYATLSTFSDSKEWSLDSKVMKHHQKSYVGNGMISKHVQDLYGKPKDFMEFVYFSQLTQAHAVASAIGGHLLDAPRCMGTLYWQLNDCWPAPTWSSVDYLGNYKALHYAVKDLFQPITLVQTDEQRKLFISVNNLEATEVTAQIEVYRLQGIKSVFLDSIQKKCALRNFESLLLHDATKVPYPHVLKVALSNGFSKVFLFGDYQGPKNRSATLRTIFLDTVTKSGKLLFENQAFMANVWFYSLTPGVRFERNFEHFLPGTHEISFTFDELPATFNFYYR